jgi:hypothetical protein
VGNVIQSVYVFHLPAGPIWLPHSFYLLTFALMLIWYLRYQWRPRGDQCDRRYAAELRARERASTENAADAAKPAANGASTE